MNCRWDGVILSVSDFICTVDEADHLIRFIEANKWLLRSSGKKHAETEALPAAKPAELASDEAKPGSGRWMEIRQIIREMWLTSASNGEIGKRVGLTHSRVWQIAKEIGLPARPSPQKRTDLDQAVTDLWEGDLTKRQIAEKLGVAASTIGRIVAELKLPSRLYQQRRETESHIPAAPVKAVAEESGAARETTSSSHEGDDAQAKAGITGGSRQNTSGESRERQTVETWAVPSVQAFSTSKPVAPSADAISAPPRTAATIEDVPAAPESVATTNGHVPSGPVLVSTSGIVLMEDAVVHAGKSVDITPTERRVLTVILRAHPNPVGADFIFRRAWPNARKAEQDETMAIASKMLRERLPMIGLELRSAKGIGMAIKVTEAAA